MRYRQLTFFGYLTKRPVKNTKMPFCSDFNTLPDKQALVAHFKGAKISELPTPNFVVDRKIFRRNCELMLENARKLNAAFRAHVKTHKTVEGTELQLGSGKLTTDRVVVSTLREAWMVMPLVKAGKINDIHFSLPIYESTLDELVAVSTQVPHLRVMLDNPEQLDMLAAYNKGHTHAKKWSIYIKINMGTNRAGLINDTENLHKTIVKALSPEVKCAVEIYGFYCHAGHSYSSKTEDAAKDFLLQEITHAHKATKEALKIDPSLQLHMSVGATPTAHASECLSVEEMEQKLGEPLAAKLELHAGNYPFCDLQQVATNCVGYQDVSIKLYADVVSTYSGRGNKGPGEQLINAGAIALARETGPMPGHGRIVEPAGYENWIVGRLSQEHGILVAEEDKPTDFIPIGTRVGVVPQHSCITAASHPWFYVVEGNEVVDVWVPWRGW